MKAFIESMKLFKKHIRPIFPKQNTIETHSEFAA